MRRVDIVGLSLAELSLALVFVVLALLPPTSQIAAADRAAAQLVEAQRIISELHVQNKELQTQLSKATESPAGRPNLRSMALPSCAETKLRNDWLFTTIINGKDQYEIAGIGTLRLEEILDRFSRDMDQARAAGCVHRIQVLLGNDVSAKDYDLALRYLEQHFYPRKLGSAQQ